MPESCAGSEDGQIYWEPYDTQGGFYSTFNGVDTNVYEATSLAPGDYVLSVTDDAGCMEETVVTVEAAPSIALDAVVTDASCFGENDGTATLFAEGGTGIFQYSSDGYSFSSSNTIGNLPAEAYTFFAQDENGCVQIVEAVVSEPDAIVVSAIVCEGCLNGEGRIDVTVYGGSLPYIYEWIGPGVSGQDGQDLEGISSGSYSIEVTDESGCSVTETFNITTIAEGCTDPAACNYAPNASIDDGSCDYSCYGCTDPEALNYAPSATLDDGSCLYFDPSCDNLGDAGWEMFETGVYPGTTEEREFGIPTTVEFALHLADFIEEPVSGQIFSVGSFSPENLIGLPSGLALANALQDMNPMSQQCVELQGIPTQQGCSRFR